MYLSRYELYKIKCDDNDSNNFLFYFDILITLLCNDYVSINSFELILKFNLHLNKYLIVNNF
jgi:hypothetical protein